MENQIIEQAVKNRFFEMATALKLPTQNKSKKNSMYYGVEVTKTHMKIYMGLTNMPDMELSCPTLNCEYMSIDQGMVYMKGIIDAVRYLKNNKS